LKVIINHTISSIELQKQFKDSLETHFPTLDDHRLVWRKQVDDLNEDIKEVYKELNNYFKNSTSQIQDFVGNNNEFFHGINAIQTAIKVFVDNSNIQKDEFTVLKSEILELRKDYHESQKQTIEMNIALIESILQKEVSSSDVETCNRGICNSYLKFYCCLIKLIRIQFN
jgi:translation elongation factor EF-G